MVFVKVRETYDLHTVQNKMTVIAIHTPKPEILKRNYPGLLMQCRAYRPYSCDVRIASASVQPLDPLGVGTEPGDVAPEDVFNPILYKAMSNKGMSQLEARINSMAASGSTADVNGQTAVVEVDSFTNLANEFNLYYGLLSETHAWNHASVQSGLSMSGLRPLVYDLVANVGDAADAVATGDFYTAPDVAGAQATVAYKHFLGKAKEFPFINCTQYTYTSSGVGEALSGFSGDAATYNAEQVVPYVKVVCGAVIIPPSRLHTLYFRMVVEWTVEFSTIRPQSEIVNWLGLASLGNNSHYMNYSYESSKKALTGTSDSILDSSDTCMVSSNVNVEKVM